jgi:hypothetical protein
MDELSVIPASQSLSGRPSPLLSNSRRIGWPFWSNQLQESGSCCYDIHTQRRRTEYRKEVRLLPSQHSIAERARFFLQILTALVSEQAKRFIDGEYIRRFCTIARWKATILRSTRASASPRCFNGGNVDFLHRHHCRKHAFCDGAASRHPVG